MGTYLALKVGRMVDTDGTKVKVTNIRTAVKKVAKVQRLKTPKLNPQKHTYFLWKIYPVSTGDYPENEKRYTAVNPLYFVGEPRHGFGL